ncbi:MAG: hypothetical protein HY650_13970 [Acidobacteria bacterium]|nr:hypothetical protein [Acidobacteriota bacterium]
MRTSRTLAALVTLLILASVPLRAQPAQRAVKGARSARTPTVDLLIPASALAVVQVDDLSRFQRAMTGSGLATLAGSTPAIEPIEAYLNDIGGQTRSGLRGAVVLFPQIPGITSGREIRLPVAQIIECPTVRSARAAFERISAAMKMARERGKAKMAGSKATLKWRGEEYMLALAGRAVVYGTAGAVNEVLKAHAGQGRMSAEANAVDATPPVRSGLITGSVRVSHFSRMIQQWLSKAGGLPPQLAPMIGPILQFAGINSVKQMTWISDLKGDRFQNQIQLTIDWAKSGLLDTILRPPPLSFQPGHELPVETTTYLASGIDLPKLYDVLLSTFGPLLALQGGRGSANEVIKGYEAELGFKIRDEFLAALGPEYVIACLPDSTPGEPASPGAVAGILKLRNPEVAERSLRKMLERAGAGKPEPNTAEVHRSVELLRIDPGFYAAIKQNVAYLGERNVVKRLLDLNADVPARSGQPDWLRPIRPVTEGRSLEFLVKREMFLSANLKSALGPEAPDSLADRLSKEASGFLEGTGIPDANGLRLNINDPIGLFAIIDFYVSASGYVKPLPVEPGEDGRSLKSMLAGLTWLGSQAGSTK